jgi:hypothetical protein
MCIEWTSLIVRIFLISPHLRIHACWKDIPHQTISSVLILGRYYICYLAKISYSTIEHVAQTVAERCSIAHCSLFVTFIYCRHSFVVYGFSKGTNFTALILQCVTIMKQDILQHFPPGPTSTPLSHTTLHLTKCLVWLKGGPCADILRYLYVYRISTVCVLVSDGGQTGVHIYFLIII